MKGLFIHILFPAEPASLGGVRASLITVSIVHLRLARGCGGMKLDIIHGFYRFVSGLVSKCVSPPLKPECLKFELGAMRTYASETSLKGAIELST